MGMVKESRYLITKRGAWPRYVVVFVTERCPAGCGHCLIGEKRYSGIEMTPNEYERTAKTMPPFYFLLFSGGEPFIRVDLPQIADAFIKHCDVRNIGIPTNGAFPSETESAVRLMTKSHPDTQFGIDVSIDAVGPAHDELRNLTGLFEKAVETYKRLAALGKRTKNLNVCVAVTLSRNNVERTDELIDYLFNDLKVTNVNPLLVRGKPRDPKSLNVDPEAYRKFVRRIEGEIEKRRGGYKGYPETEYINAMKEIRSRIIYETLRTGEMQSPCYAARLGVVIRANGDVTACEIRKPVLGNLYEALWDFRKIWKSAGAKAERRAIRSEKCFCTYECFHTLNILYNLRFLPEILSGRRAGAD